MPLPSQFSFSIWIIAALGVPNILNTRKEAPGLCVLKIGLRFHRFWSRWFMIFRLQASPRSLKKLGQVFPPKAWPITEKNEGGAAVWGSLGREVVGGTKPVGGWWMDNYSTWGAAGRWNNENTAVITPVSRDTTEVIHQSKTSTAASKVVGSKKHGLASGRMQYSSEFDRFCATTPVFRRFQLCRIPKFQIDRKHTKLCGVSCRFRLEPFSSGSQKPAPVKELIARADRAIPSWLIY